MRFIYITNTGWSSARLLMPVLPFIAIVWANGTSSFKLTISIWCIWKLLGINSGKRITEHKKSQKQLSKISELFYRATMITKVRKNMKNRLMSIQDKIMLKKRGFIETIFSSIKSLNTFVHHRHRSPINAFCHIFAGLINYQIREDKPSLENKFSNIAYP